MGKRMGMMAKLKTHSTPKIQEPPAQQGVPSERKTGFEPATLTLAEDMTLVGLRPLVPLSRVFPAAFPLIP